MKPDINLVLSISIVTLLFLIVFIFFDIFVLTKYIDDSTIAVKQENIKNYNLIYNLNQLNLMKKAEDLYSKDIEELSKIYKMGIADNNCSAVARYKKQLLLERQIASYCPLIIPYDHTCFHNMWSIYIVKDYQAECFYIGKRGYSEDRINSTDVEYMTIDINGFKQAWDGDSELKIKKMDCLDITVDRSFIDIKTGILEFETIHRTLNL